MNIRLTIPLALLTGALIFGGSFLASTLNQDSTIREARAQVRENEKTIAKHSERLSVLEERWGALCEDMRDIKKTMKEMQRDQLDFYKSFGYTPKPRKEETR